MCSKPRFFPSVTSGNRGEELDGDCGLVCACFLGALIVFSAWMRNQWHWVHCGHWRNFFLPYDGQSASGFIYWPDYLRLSKIIGQFFLQFSSASTWTSCHPEDKGRKFLRNIGKFNHYMVPTPQRLIISSTTELNDSLLADQISRLYLKKKAKILYRFY